MARKQVPAAKPAEETSMPEPTETIEEPTVAEPVVEEPQAVETEPEIVAEVDFIDSLTGRGYRVGEVVTGWPLERGHAYARRGVVRLVGPSLTAETGPSEVA